MRHQDFLVLAMRSYCFPIKLSLAWVLRKRLSDNIFSHFLRKKYRKYVITDSFFGQKRRTKSVDIHFLQLHTSCDVSDNIIFFIILILFVIKKWIAGITCHSKNKTFSFLWDFLMLASNRINFGCELHCIPSTA